MNMLALCDFAGFTHDEVVRDLAEDFQSAGCMDGASCIVAYMSVGSFGCDSSAFIVFERNGEIWEVNGSHCSCYGFEGQWEPELVNDVETICIRDDLAIAGGGYDDDRKHNASKIRQHLREYSAKRLGELN